MAARWHAPCLMGFGANARSIPFTKGGIPCCVPTKGYVFTKVCWPPCSPRCSRDEACGTGYGRCGSRARASSQRAAWRGSSPRTRAAASAGCAPPAARAARRASTPPRARRQHPRLAFPSAPVRAQAPMYAALASEAALHHALAAAFFARHDRLDNRCAAGACSRSCRRAPAELAPDHPQAQPDRYDGQGRRALRGAQHPRLHPLQPLEVLWDSRTAQARDQAFGSADHAATSVVAIWMAVASR